MTSSRARHQTAAAAGDSKRDNPEAAAQEICLRLLTAAPRTRAQLEEALRRRGVPQQAADAALDRLARAGLIDDAAFARAWVDSRHRGRGLARRALTAELRQRGVDEGDVRAAVADLGPEEEAAAARRLVDAKLAATRGRPLATRMRRLTGLLARKGYPAGLAYRVIREALDQEGIDPANAGLEMEAVLDADMAMTGEPDPDTDQVLATSLFEDPRPGLMKMPRLREHLGLPGCLILHRSSPLSSVGGHQDLADGHEEGTVAISESGRLPPRLRGG